MAGLETCMAIDRDESESIGRRLKEMEPTPEQTAFMAKNWRDLIRPRTLEIEERSDTYGKFSCEPLERGFGTTLGVALRRILLSSLQGAAITHISLEGALHEFTALPGV